MRRLISAFKRPKGLVEKLQPVRCGEGYVREHVGFSLP
jgi:hypothetical protein